MQVCAALFPAGEIGGISGGGSAESDMPLIRKAPAGPGLFLSLKVYLIYE